jgi:hypothetical protein
VLLPKQLVTVLLMEQLTESTVVSEVPRMRVTIPPKPHVMQQEVRACVCVQLLGVAGRSRSVTRSDCAAGRGSGCAQPPPHAVTSTAILDTRGVRACAVIGLQGEGLGIMVALSEIVDNSIRANASHVTAVRKPQQDGGIALLFKDDGVSVCCAVLC